MTFITKFTTTAALLVALPTTVLAFDDLDDWDPGYEAQSQGIGAAVPSNSFNPSINGLGTSEFGGVDVVPGNRPGTAGAPGGEGRAGSYSRDNCYLVSAEYDSDGNVIPTSIVRSCN